MPGLPKRQLFVLACCRLAEPIAYTSVFPYLYNVIRDLNITDDEKKIGKYGGLVSSVFSLGSFLTGLTWGRASDVYGRKPIILLGLIGTIISTLVFGFSTSIYQLVGSRLAAGLLNGNVGVIRTVVAEMVTDRQYQATAFSIMPIVWSVGSIFGPALGGSLADPVRAYPSIFKGNAFFTKFRYALPNLVSAGFLFCSVSIGWLFLEETLAVKKAHKDTGLRVKDWIARHCCTPTSSRRHGYKKAHYRLASTNSVSDDVEAALLNVARPSTAGGSEAIEALGDFAQQHKEAPAKVTAASAAAAAAAPPLRALFTYQVTLNIIAYSLLSMHTTSFDQIFPIFLATSIKDGGLGLEPKIIGMLLSIMGVVAMLLQILVFPPVQRKLGSVVTFRVSLIFYCLVYTMIPFMQRLAGHSEHVVYGGILLALFGKIIAGVFAFPVSAILVTNSVPSPRLLGSVNGLNQASGSFMRMLGPAVFGFLLSYSLSSAYPALVWLCLASLAGVGFIVTLFLVEDVRKPELQAMVDDVLGRTSHELPAHDSDDEDDDDFDKLLDDELLHDDDEQQDNDVANYLADYEQHERRKRIITD